MADDYSMNTACVVADYFNFRIQKAGYVWQVSPTRNCPNNTVNVCIRQLCEDFEKRYSREFKEMCSSSAEVSLERESYFEVLKQLLEDGLNWGRVIAVFSFGGQMCLYCMREGKPNQVDLVREWTCLFMERNVNDWIHSQGGWVCITLIWSII